MPPPPDLERLVNQENYPGMIPAESRILRAFIRKHGAEFDAFDFHVRLGEGVRLEGDLSPERREHWFRRTQMRPDVVARRAPDVAVIVEAKEVCDNATIWQVLAYRDEYRTAFPGETVVALVVAEGALPQAAKLADSQGVRVLLYTLPPDALPAAEATEAEA